MPEPETARLPFAASGRPDWMDAAACRDLPTDLFFPADTDDAGTERAKTVCRSCPVRRPCVAYALADPTLEGVWGASTERQRINRRRQLRQAG
jgi:WhiB family redox-sensing transcriptional regulator